MTYEENGKVVFSMLQREVQSFEEGKQEFQLKVSKNPLEAVQWCRDIVKAQVIAETCSPIIEGNPDTETMIARLRESAKRMTDNLLSNYYHCDSSSAFRNAVQDTKREAISEILDRIQSYIDFFND